MRERSLDQLSQLIVVMKEILSETLQWLQATFIEQIAYFRESLHWNTSGASMIEEIGGSQSDCSEIHFAKGGAESGLATNLIVVDEDAQIEIGEGPRDVGTHGLELLGAEVVLRENGNHIGV